MEKRCALQKVRRIRLFLMLSLLWTSAAIGQTDPTDLAVLQSLVKLLKNPQLLGGWNGDDPCGSGWPHLQCRGGFVTAISLPAAGLIGTLPENLNMLSRLEYIGLQNNALYGALPSLSGLQNLQIVYLDSNNFNIIPANFFHGLPNLQAMYLDHNNLNSSTGWLLPPDVATCTSLSNLSLTNTSLSGEIPYFLGKMPSLRVLNLAYNKLSGGIPASFAGSSLLQLQANNMIGPVLTGPIDAVGEIPSLTELWLQVNQITGTIPAGLSNALTLQNLKLNDNQLTGVIPQNFTALPLSVFTIDNNKLLGAIPTFQKGVNFLFFGNNFCQSTAGIPCSAEVNALLSFVAAVGFPAQIVSSWQGNDPCSGWIGISCDPSPHVSAINLPSHHLNGTLSPALGDLKFLVHLKLNANNLKGTIPLSLTKLKALKEIDLSNNDLSGAIPNFPLQVTLKLQGNNALIKQFAPFTPPVALPSASSPEFITSSVPSGSAIPSTSPVLPSGSETPSSFPSPLSTSASPAAIAPSGNGSNPPLRLPSNAMENFAEKHMSLSVSIGVIVSVVVLVFLMLLMGCILYKKHQSKKILHVQGPNTPMLHPQESSSGRDMVNMVVAAGDESSTEAHSISSRGSSELQVVEAGNLVVSIQVLKNATHNFSEQNILGRGGFGVVYKGELENGNAIAVKRMEASVISSKGVNEFQAEIAVLTKVRHRHLVALLGYCTDGHEKLLVYEYLSNGTLGQHLFEYSKLGWKPLSWTKRVSIALDVARAMEYLHGLAYKSFIHRDLKPSNILLDDDYRAKVSDFGLVKLAPEGKFSLETRLAGTFGYLAPEYAVTGRVTTKADVFSFGVVLMELITGRRALDETQSEENLHLVAWFRRMQASKDSFMSVIDPVVKIDADGFQSLCTVAELAGHCTEREPYRRPDMGYAVNILTSLMGHWKPKPFEWEDDADIVDPYLIHLLAPRKGHDIPGSSIISIDDSLASIPTRPLGFADTFTSADAR